MLSRRGNKAKIAPILYRHFPLHKMRITMFFGAGGEFFNTPKAPYNILNDLDDDITNLYEVVSSSPDQLVEELEIMPVSQKLLDQWKIKRPVDPVRKAAQFLLASNFTYLGKQDTIRYGLGNEKATIISNIKKTYLKLGDTKIMNKDYKEVIPSISFSKKVITREESFVYMDPVYLDTSHSYRVPNWTKDDTYNCFEIMENEGIKCAMSEFMHPFVLNEAKSRRFNIIPIKRRKNIKNRKNEILITNYKSNLLFN